MPLTWTFEEATSTPATWEWEEPPEIPTSSRFVPPTDVQIVPTTPAEQQAVNIAMQRVDPRWNERPPEPTIGRLIGQGMDWVNRTFKAPEEPMPAPLTPIIAPPAAAEPPDAADRRALPQRVYDVQHPVRAGVGRAAEKLAVTMAEPAGPLGIAATPVAPSVMLPMWAALGTEGSLDAIQRIQRARETGDRAAYYEATADLGINAPMIAAPLLHAKTVLPPEAITPPPPEPTVLRPILRAKVQPGVRARIALPTMGEAGNLPIAPEAVREVPVEPVAESPTEPPAPAALSAEEQAAAPEVPAARAEEAPAAQPAAPAPAEAPAPREPWQLTRAEAEGAAQAGTHYFDSLYRMGEPRTKHVFLARSQMDMHLLGTVGKPKAFHGVRFRNPLVVSSRAEASTKMLGRNAYAGISGGKVGEVSDASAAILKADDLVGDAAAKAGYDAVVTPHEIQVVDASVLPESEPLTGEEWEGIGHKKAVERALREGKPVPPEVLADYPDLRAPAPTAPAAPASPGPGAASPSEFAPERPFETSVKNAVTEAKRATRGMPAVEEEAARKWGDVWDSVKAQVEEDPTAPARLVAELQAKPRAVTDREDAMLLHQQVSLEDQFNRTVRKMVDAAETPGAEAVIAEHRIELARLSDELLALYDVDKSVGRETARGLNARKMMSDETYSLVRMELAKRAANDGRRLTPEESVAIQALHDKIAATQKAFDEHVAKADARIRELETQHAVDELKIAAGREARADTASGTVRDLDAERANITAGLGERAPNAPLRDLRPWIRKLALNFVRSGITERDALVNAVHDVLKDIVPGIDRRVTMDAISGYGDFRPLDPEAAKAQLRDLSGQMQNVAKLEDLLARKALSKTGPERKVPSAEERRLTKLVNEYKKRYGVTVTDPAAQLKSALDAVKTRLRNAIADLDFQIKTGKKIVRGQTKLAYDAEAQALAAQRDALKARFDEVFGKPELTDEQRVAMAKGALEKSIAEYERRIKASETSTPKKPSKTPQTPELQALRAKRDALRGQLDYLREILDPKRTPEEIALASLKTRLRNSTADLQDRIARGDFTKRPRRSVTLDAEAQRLKADNLRAREQFQRDLLADRLKQRTPFQRWTDIAVKVRRASLLSSPVTLAKLTTAAVQRMVFTPLEEAIGAGYGKLPGYAEVARRAPTEGGFSAKAEAKAITSALTLGMRDAAQTLKTGRSNLELLHGGRTAEGGFSEASLMPRSWLDFFGELHGALKAPVKRAAFERAMQKQIEFGIRNGVDVTDPVVLASYSVEAYKSGRRSIFLQDNHLVSAINSFLAKRIDPVTGRPTAVSQTMSTVGRVLLPIVRVPTNLVAEAMQYATGSVTGNVRLARALRRGIDTLPPAEADLIMRQLKKGSIGGAFMLAGYLLPEFIGGYYQPHEKRDKSDVKVGGIGPVPSYVLHNPLLETLQLGSTVRRVADSSLTKRHPDEQGLVAGLLAGVLGLGEEVPLIREMLEVTKAFDPHERGAFFGELTKSLVVPQLLQWIARQMDKDAEGEVIPRKPGTVLEHIETGIPGARETVPEPRRTSR